MWMNIIAPHVAKGPTGPTTKNQLNYARIDLNGLPNTVKKGERSEKEVITVFFFFFSLRLVSFFITLWPLKVLETTSYKGKKKAQGSREEPPISKVGFFKLYYLLFLTNNYETVILKYRHHFL
jgi:hypothetical protein